MECIFCDNEGKRGIREAVVLYGKENKNIIQMPLIDDYSDSNQSGCSH